MWKFLILEFNLRPCKNYSSHDHSVLTVGYSPFWSVVCWTFSSYLDSFGKQNWRRALMCGWCVTGKEHFHTFYNWIKVWFNCGEEILIGWDQEMEGDGWMYSICIYIKYKIILIKKQTWMKKKAWNIHKILSIKQKH